MVECELESDPKFVEWMKKRFGLDNADYKAFPLEVRRGWREQYRRDHGTPTSVEVLAKLLDR